MPARCTYAVAAAVGVFLAAGTASAQLSTDRTDPAAVRKFEEGIRQNLQTYFQMNPIVGGESIRIEVDRNVVTLRGDVATWREHDRAIEAARLTTGVQNVIDQLRVREAERPLTQAPVTEPTARPDLAQRTR